MIELIVGLAENLTPIALTGVGGIGKTSIALTVLHHDRVKQRFQDNRRFIRCNEFPASRTHFLSRLSHVIGAGIENPEDLTPLRTFLSSREMILFLDNAESILDPQGTNAREIYAVVKELSEFDNICLCITSRISTIPPTCKAIDIPPLSAEAARDTFYCIYENGGGSDLVNGVLEQLDFHPLSITLLATVAYHNKWNADRLTREWERRRTRVLHTRHDESLATTIELSLASPMFQELGPDARGLLSVIAFLPQGVNENNLEWFFPTLPNVANIFDTFCVLSLTYRNDGFVTMLAPLRDHLYPKDPTSYPLLLATKDHHFRRLSVNVRPGRPGFEEARWIKLEDVNVEHLLDVFTSIDATSVDIWDACAYFMEHLYWHKRRLVVFGRKIESLPDEHRSKPECLFQLSRLFESVGNRGECKRLLVRALSLYRERGNHHQVAKTLKYLSNANRQLGLCEEGIQQVKEALGIYERLNHLSGLADAWQRLARLLYDDKRLDAAEEAASRAINLLLGKGEHQFLLCKCHRLLGLIHRSKGETEKAIDHFETALGIASSFDWHIQLFWNHYSLAVLFFGGNRFGDAHAHVERAKSHAVNDPYWLGLAMELQVGFWCDEHRFEEARSEALRAIGVFERLGATKDLEDCRAILQNIEEALSAEPATSLELNFNGGLLDPMLLQTPANSRFPVQGTAR